MIEAPLDKYRDVVRPEWIDHNRHMNVGYYLVVFDYATDEFFRWIGLDEARRILTERLEDLHTVAKALLEYETLSGDEIINVVKGVKPNREEPESRLPPSPRVSVPLAPRPDPEPA